MKLFLIFLLALNFFTPTITFAADACDTTFTPLTCPIVSGAARCNTALNANGCFTDPCTTCHLLALAGHILSDLIAIAVLLAVVLFVYAGWILLTTPIADHISRAKRIFWNTFFGLIVILAAWLIVDTILSTVASGGKRLNGITFSQYFCSDTTNTDATALCEAKGFGTVPIAPGPGVPASFTSCYTCADTGGSVCATGATAEEAQNACVARQSECTAPSACAAPPPTTPPPTPGGPDSMTHGEALTRLSTSNPPIEVVSSGNCSDRNNSNCTSLDGVLQTTLDGVVSISNAVCGPIGSTCVIVTGGTEVGHETDGSCTHGSGCKIDIHPSPAVDSYITSFPEIGVRGDGARQYRDSCGNIYARESNHWDISYLHGACP